jgi:hypothetical protein
MSTVEELRITKNPRAEDVRAAVRKATFPVELPVGLQRGTTIAEMLHGPSFILLDYNLPGAWRRSDHLLRIALVDPRTIGTESSPHAFVMRMGGTAAKGAVHWNIAHEVVIVMKSTITPAELAHLRSAMVAKSLGH